MQLISPVERLWGVFSHYLSLIWLFFTAIFFSPHTYSATCPYVPLPMSQLYLHIYFFSLISEGKAFYFCYLVKAAKLWSIIKKILLFNNKYLRINHLLLLLKSSLQAFLKASSRLSLLSLALNSSLEVYPPRG